MLKPSANSINFGLHAKSREFLNKIQSDPSTNIQTGRVILSINNNYTVSKYSTHLASNGFKTPLHRFCFGKGETFYEVLDSEVKEKDELQIYTMLARKKGEEFIPIEETRWPTGK
jgi:hypothetical protein